ncbi:HET-domain-containing protein [Hyaloscypha variabilis F]|uniref:HET-domain-containing protein n=1 Tax=Hyaloscypha variabilis (strain UAMH 11265 / GT02V1 / F) TaxID=1149755 RepID=A0A2J6R6Y2_HYAVF|nr:HET-domain-containing protein [Hyaloscypha variabilis F]
MPTFPAHNDVYRYQALDATRQQIRLIKLVKNTSSKRPRCKIYTFDLASAPKYIALSYTWGPPDPSRRILVDKKAFEVRENLYNFLCSFQTGSAITTDIAYIYIDQISIDQENLQERNSQVRLMSDIYTQSSHVVVWLGSDPKMVKAAHAILDDMEDTDERGRVPTSNFRILLSNAYFTRLWIVQEVSLASKINSAKSLGTLDVLFKEKDQKEKWRLDELFAKYSVHECQDPRDKEYGFLGMVPDWQRPVVDYAKSTHQVFLDVIPIFLNIYWANKPTEATCEYSDVTARRFYGRFRIYLENMLKLAWNMEFPDHDQRGLISLFKEIAVVEDVLSRNQDDPSLTFSDVIEGFGYEAVDSDVADEGEGVLIGRWWMALGDEKYYHDCRTATEPLDQLFAWQFLDDVQKRETWPGKEAEEASLQRILDANDAYPYDSESDVYNSESVAYDSESDVYEDVDEQRWESESCRRAVESSRVGPADGPEPEADRAAHLDALLRPPAGGSRHRMRRRKVMARTNLRTLRHLEPEAVGAGRWGSPVPNLESPDNRDKHQ